jgi:hypothetical protein
MGKYYSTVISELNSLNQAGFWTHEADLIQRR